MTSLRLRPAFACLLLLASCSSNSDTKADHPDAGEDISDVIYVGGVTDEALENMLAITPKNDAHQVMVIAAPDLSAPVPAESAATFEFHPASEAHYSPAPRLAPARHTGSNWQHVVHEVVQFLSPVRVAHAHGEPYNGSAYYLVFSDAKSNTQLQVFTTKTSFTPESVDWQNLVQAAQPLSLTITSAFFDDNAVPIDGGPFVGGTFPFSIE